jgi:hypothetical protein
MDAADHVYSHLFTNFGIFDLLVRYWSSVDDFPLNKSIKMTPRMQVAFSALHVENLTFYRANMVPEAVF